VTGKRTGWNQSTIFLLRCNGGYLLSAWQYWVSDGIVTGGNYTDKNGCRPYPLPPCEHHENGTHYPPCQHNLYPTPDCSQTCQAGYPTPYAQDKHYGKTAYGVDSDVASIQQEIYTNGPVEAAFDVSK
jgi:cathepsin B